MLLSFFTFTSFRVIEAVVGDAGDAGIDGHCRCEGLMLLDVFISDSTLWCLIFWHRKAMNSCTCIAAMLLFFQWLRVHSAGIEENRLPLMDDAPAQSANMTHTSMSEWTADVNAGQVQHTTLTSIRWTLRPGTRCGMSSVDLKASESCHPGGATHGRVADCLR